MRLTLSCQKMASEHSLLLSVEYSVGERRYHHCGTVQDLWTTWSEMVRLAPVLVSFSVLENGMKVWDVISRLYA
jgi:hypothetical protein